MDELQYVIDRMLPVVLRDYQTEGIDQLSRGYKAIIGTGVKMNRQLYCLPTGGGKTIVATETIQRALRRILAKHLKEPSREVTEKISILVDRNNLVEQTSATLENYKVPHGVVQGKHWRTRPEEIVQVCSAQTCEARKDKIGGGIPSGTTLLIVDECHATRKYVNDWIEAHPEVRVLGLTATPFSKGLGLLYQQMVSTITMNELIARKHLVPIRMFAAKAIDMRGARLNKFGEWSDKDVETRGRVVIGDIPQSWHDGCMQAFGRVVKTICFAPTVEYGRDLCERFQRLGFNFQHISYKVAEEEAMQKIAEFRKPDSEILGLVSCEVFTKGFDVGDVYCGISARPYKNSLTNHIQQLGRVARPYPGKEFALWLDHSGNAKRFLVETDNFFQFGPGPLDVMDETRLGRKEPNESEKKAMTCSCGFILSVFAERCPACGKERVRKTFVKQVAGQMGELGKVGQKETFLMDQFNVWEQLKSLSEEKRSGDAARAFAYVQFKRIYKRDPPCRYDQLKGGHEVEPALREMVRKNVANYNIAQQYMRKKNAQRSI